MSFIMKVFRKLLPTRLKNGIKRRIASVRGIVATIRRSEELLTAVSKKVSNIDYRLNLLTNFYVDTTKAHPARGRLREFQLADVSMLEKTVKILNERNLKWWLAYGSALGTVRHGGFVPWDDDLDIGMVKEDFDSLFEYKKDFEAVGLKLVVWWHVGRMARIVSQSRDDIFIDIYANKNVDGWIWPLPPWEENFYAKKALPIDIILPCNNTYCFEGVSVNLPADPDKYLTALYGDYMALPPAPHDVPGHFSVNHRLTFTPPPKPDDV